MVTDEWQGKSNKGAHVVNENKLNENIKENSKVKAVTPYTILEMN